MFTHLILFLLSFDAKTNNTCLHNFDKSKAGCLLENKTALIVYLSVVHKHKISNALLSKNQALRLKIGSNSKT